MKPMKTENQYLVLNWWKDIERTIKIEGNVPHATLANGTYIRKRHPYQDTGVTVIPVAAIYRRYVRREKWHHLKWRLLRKIKNIFS